MQNVDRKHYCFLGRHNSAMHIGQKLKMLMRARGISPAEMAQHCGVSRGAVSNWFSSGRISKDNLAKAAAWLGVSGDEIVTGLLTEVAGSDDVVLELPEGSQLLVKRKGVVRPKSIPSITITDELPSGLRPASQEVTAALRLLAFVFERVSPIARAAAAPALQSLALSPGDWEETARVINRLIDDGLGESPASPGRGQAAGGRN